MQIQKTVFISYRRLNIPIAILVHKHLSSHGFDVFFDYASLDSGAFNQNILNHIAARAHFVLILTPSALERCVSSTDWVRIEIEEAIKLKRNIIPLFFEKFEFNDSIKPYLKGDLLPLLPDYNGLNVHWDYLDAGLDRLRERFLSKPLELIQHPIPKASKAETEAAKAILQTETISNQEALKAQEHYERGIALARLSKDKMAIEEFNRVIAFDTNFAEAYYRRAVAFSNIGEIAKALEDCAKAVEIAPAHPKVNLMMAFMYTVKGEFYKALKEAEQGVILNSELDEAYFRRARVYESRKNFEEAIIDYSTVIDLNPNYVIAYNNRGRTYQELKDYKQALGDYNKAIELNPEFAAAYYSRGFLYHHLKDYKQALDDYNKAIELNPDNSYVYNSRGWLYQEQLAYKQALNDYSKAVALNPNELSFQHNLRVIKIISGLE